MDNIELTVTTAAVLFSPLVAVQTQTYLDRGRVKQQKRLDIFHTLMATRASRVSAVHVEALNRIDIEFYGRNYLGNNYKTKPEQEVLSSWHIYRDHLNTSYDESGFAVWAAKGEELFIDLLYQLSKALRYNFDKVDLKRSVYSPIAHSKQEYQQEIIRDNLVKVLSGKQALSMSVSIPETLPVQDNHSYSANLTSDKA